MITPFKKISLNINRTPNFELTVAELKDYIDFEIKRFYYIQDFKGPTGAHCHYVEDELFVILKGKCTAVIDRGNGIEDVEISTHDGIVVKHMIWHGFKNTSDDCMILALSSTNYNPDRSDYVDDYEVYLKIRDIKLKEYSN